MITLLKCLLKPSSPALPMCHVNGCVFIQKNGKKTLSDTVNVNLCLLTDTQSSLPPSFPSPQLLYQSYNPTELASTLLSTDAGDP